MTQAPPPAFGGPPLCRAWLGRLRAALGGTSLHARHFGGLGKLHVTACLVSAMFVVHLCIRQTGLKRSGERCGAWAPAQDVEQGRSPRGHRRGRARGWGRWSGTGGPTAPCRVCCLWSPLLVFVPPLRVLVPQPDHHLADRGREARSPHCPAPQLDRLPMRGLGC